MCLLFHSLTALHLACHCGKYEVAKLLVENDADMTCVSDDIEWTPLHFAVGKGHVNIAKMLLENGADVDVVEKDRGCTPLHIAAMKGHMDCVKLLLQNGADANAHTANGELAIYLAAIAEHYDIAGFLRDYTTVDLIPGHIIRAINTSPVYKGMVLEMLRKNRKK